MTSYSTLRRAAKAKATPAWIDQHIRISNSQDPQFFRLASTPDGLTLHIAVCDDRAAVNRPDGAVGVWVQLYGPLGCRLQERYRWDLPLPAGWAAAGADWESFNLNLSRAACQLIDQLPPDEAIGLELMNRGKTLRECGASLLQ